MNESVSREDFATQPLHEAVRPRGNREEVGALGEAIHALADVLHTQGGDAAIAKSATPAEVWCELKQFINASTQCRHLVRSHLPALRALKTHANRT